MHPARVRLRWCAFWRPGQAPRRIFHAIRTRLHRGRRSRPARGEGHLRRSRGAPLRALRAPAPARRRLELMSGIQERRFFPPGTRPSSVAAAAGADLLERTGFDRDRVGALIHASVCRDFMEPATASVVHARLELSPRCTVFDLSNACLGAVNAMTVVASQIERGEIEAGLVVAGGNGATTRGRDTLGAAHEARRHERRREARLRVADDRLGSRRRPVDPPRRRQHRAQARGRRRPCGDPAPRALPRWSRSRSLGSFDGDRLRGPAARRSRHRARHMERIPRRARLGRHLRPGRHAPGRRRPSTRGVGGTWRRCDDRLPHGRDPGEHRLGLPPALPLQGLPGRVRVQGAARGTAGHWQRAALLHARRALVGRSPNPQEAPGRFKIASPSPR